VPTFVADLPSQVTPEPALEVLKRIAASPKAAAAVATATVRTRNHPLAIRTS
jgi:hypothetical protein